MAIIPSLGRVLLRAEGEPGLNPCFGTEFLIQLAHSGFVVAGVAQENAEGAGGHEDELQIGIEKFARGENRDVSEGMKYL